MPASRSETQPTRGAVRRPAPSLHRRACWPRCRSAPTARRLPADPRRRARAVRPPARLPVLAALRLRFRRLPHGPSRRASRAGARPRALSDATGTGLNALALRGGVMTAVLEARRPDARLHGRRAARSAPRATIKALAGVSFSLRAGARWRWSANPARGKSTLARLADHDRTADRAARS